MPTPRSKPIAPPLDANGRPRASATLKEWGMPRGHDTQWQRDAAYREHIHDLVSARLAIFEQAGLWDMCPLKACRRAKGCTGAVKQGGRYIEQPPCVRSPHERAAARAGGKRPGASPSAKVERQFAQCWTAFRTIAHLLRDDIRDAIHARGAAR